MKINKHQNNKSAAEDQMLELTLRPRQWKDYVGQEKLKSNLKLMMEAAKQRKEVCDHILFYGQPGLGKTTLAYLLAQEMGTTIKITSGPALEKTGDVAALLTNLEPYEILFIDEAHRMNKSIEETFYPALEGRKLNLIIGKGPSARTLSLDLPPFTLIAATTKVNLLSSPLRSRFGATFKLDYYKTEDIEQIIQRSSKLLKMKITSEAVKKLATSSRFTPRTANRLLKRCRDYSQVHNKNVINEDVVEKTMQMLEIDELGLELADRYLLEIIIKKFNGGPVGLKAMGAALNEEIGTIEDVYEPFLMSVGFLHRTPAGRIVTPAGYQHLKLPQLPSATLI